MRECGVEKDSKRAREEIVHNLVFVLGLLDNRLLDNYIINIHTQLT